jgi:hypothetical protein
MPQIGSKGANLDIVVRQGATFGPNRCTLTNPDTSPVNITGFTFRGQIRKTASDPLSTGISAVFTIVNGTSGIFDWEFAAADTAGLTADSVSETAPASIYTYDVEMEDSSGRVTPLLYGTVNVFREVTKPA